jgi:hypothetical protein
MPAGRTYTPIARTTLSTSTATVSFTGISGSYTDLVLVINATSSASGNVWVRLNSDSNTNYSYTVLSGTGSSTISARAYDTDNGLLSNYYGTPSSSVANVTIFQLLNYSNTTTYKTSISRSNRSDSGTDAVVALWRSTSAVTSLLLRFAAAQTFSSGSTFTLYGIAAA